MLYPLLYERFTTQLAAEGGSPFIMLTQFMREWFDETTRWTNQLLKVTAAESPANADLLTAWTSQWLARMEQALTPVAELAFGADGAAQLAAVKQELLARLAKQGIKV